MLIRELNNLWHNKDYFNMKKIIEYIYALLITWIYGRLD